jgi:hypothetical protein
LSSCAVAPLSTHTTARTNGAGNSVLTAGSTMAIGNTPAVPTVRYSLGLNDGFDLGFQYEVVEYGVSGKLRLVGGGEGFSMAALAGAGFGFNGYYFFGGPIFSYKTGIFEPYFFTRLNYVNYPTTDVNVSNVGNVHVDPGIYTYLQHTLGFFLWPLDWFGFGAEASGFTTIGGPFILKGNDHYLVSGQVSFKF